MSRNYGLDLARILAAYMVMAGHLIYGGSVAIGRPYSDWSGANEVLPLLSNNSMWELDGYLLSNFGTALAIIGVSLFFLISGWLMPPMLKKYSRSQFLLNRFLRIFPLLVFAVLFAAAIQYFAGEKNILDISDVFATATLTASIFGKPLTLGVVWTLIVEFEFYLLLALIGLITQRGVLIASCGVLLVTVVCAKLNYSKIFFLPELYFIIYMLFGSSARLAYDQFKQHKSKTVFLVPILVLVLFELNRYVLVAVLGVHPAQDINSNSLLVTVTLLCLFAFAGKVISKNWATRQIVEKISDLTYSIYLLHLGFGVFLISRLRDYLSSDFLILVVTFALVTVFSVITYRFIELPGINAFKKLARCHKDLQ